MIMSAVEKLLENNGENLALRRLRATLTLWERNKQNYNFLYICARNKGEKIGAVWVKKEQAADQVIEKEFAAFLGRATSFELEFIYAPEQRKLDLSKKNQWNSLRGRRAIFIDYSGKKTHTSGLEMIAGNLSFVRVAHHHLAQCEDSSYVHPMLQVTLYRTLQYYCGNGRSATSTNMPTRLHRGNLVVSTGDINRNSVLNTIGGMTTWLASQVNGEGQAN